MHGQARKLQSELVKEAQGKINNNKKTAEESHAQRLNSFPTVSKIVWKLPGKICKVVHHVRLANRNRLNLAFKNCTLIWREIVEAKLVGSVMAKKRKKSDSPPPPN